MLQQLYEWLRHHWHALGAISYCLLRMWMLRRRNVWLRKLLALEVQRGIDSTNETWRIASTAYASGEPVTLDDLLSSAERDWSLRSSIPPSTATPTTRRSEHSGLNLKPKG